MPQKTSICMGRGGFNWNTAYDITLPLVTSGLLTSQEQQCQWVPIPSLPPAYTVIHPEVLQQITQDMAAPREHQKGATVALGVKIEPQMPLDHMCALTLLNTSLFVCLKYKCITVCCLATSDQRRRAFLASLSFSLSVCVFFGLVESRKSQLDSCFPLANSVVYSRKRYWKSKRMSVTTCSRDRANVVKFHYFMYHLCSKDSTSVSYKFLSTKSCRRRSGLSPIRSNVFINNA